MIRLALSLVAFLLITSIGLGGVFDYVFQTYGQAEQAQDDPRLQQFASLLTSVSALADTADASQALAAVSTLQNDVQLDVVAESALSLPAALNEQLRTGQVLTIEDEQSIAMFKYLPATSQLLVLTLPPEDASHPPPWIRIAFTGAFYVLLVGFLLLWLWPLIRRLLVLRETARQFGQGQLTQRIDVGRVSYIRDLETDFNLMAQRIERLIGDVKLISSAVSHDLRTPLAKIRMGLDILSEESDPDKRREYEARIDQHLDDMLELVETLLGYARLEQARPDINSQPVSLRKLLPGIIEHNRDARVQVELVTDNTNSVSGDSKYLKIALNNVVHNAIKHANHQVRVVLQQENSQLTVVISDDGEGVDPALAENMFKPFVRGNQAKQSGFGMGLAIVQRIMEWHHASVKVDRCPDLGGARFTLTFAAG